MKTDKSTGLSEIVIEMVTTDGSEFITNITNLVNRVVYDGKTPSDWNLSNIVKCFQGKENAVDQGNYCKLKLLYWVMKNAGQFLDGIVSAKVNIDNLQVRFTTRR